MRRPALVALAALFVTACGRTEVVRFSDDEPDAAVDAGRDAGTDAGIDAGYDAGVDAGCLPRSVPLEPAVPTVMFVIDRSGSMAEDLDGRLDGGASRWRVLETSLRRVLPPLDQKIAMGALMYPVNATACTLPTNVDLSPARGNATRLLSLFTTRPIGGTPTFGAVSTAARHLASLRTASSARALVLATDGAPNCNTALNRLTCTCTRTTSSGVCDSSTNCLDDARTITELRDLYGTSNLPTYVVGLGSQLNQFAATLDAMAVAGGVPRMGTGTRYYSASSEAELTDAFARITAQLTRCTFLLNGLGPNDTFAVRVNDDAVPQGPEGWEWLNQANGELTLHGMACDRVAGGASASVLVDCH